MLSWSRRRQLMYLSIFSVIVLAILAIIYYVSKPVPTCFDGKQNQDELGVDCGGSCAVACASQITPLTVWWTRVFDAGNGTYDAAALVENQNAKFGTGDIAYVIRLFDKDNVLLAERSGTTFFSPQEKFVIYEAGIDTGVKIPTHAFLYFGNQAVWEKATYQALPLAFGAKDYSNSPQPRLATTLTNTSLNSLHQVAVVAVLSDADGNAVAASQTVVDVLAAGETKNLNFTWPTSFSPEPTVRDVYPKLSSFSTSSPN